MSGVTSSLRDAPWGPGVRIIATDRNGLAALEKPEGILSHPNRDDDLSRSLVAAPYDENTECFDANTAKVHLINRLDSATSGVILVAASVDVARAARAEFARHNVRKTYVALVFGRTRSRRETWKARLAIRKERGTIRTQADPTGVAAETEVESLLTYPGQPLLSLIALHPRTGRSHQLRAQCQKHRLPIVGDATYGDFTRNRTFAQKTGQTRLFLHSLQTELTYRLHGKAHSFMAESPVPYEFEQGS